MDRSMKIFTINQTGEVIAGTMVQSIKQQISGVFVNSPVIIVGKKGRGRDWKIVLVEPTKSQRKKLDKNEEIFIKYARFDLNQVSGYYKLLPEYQPDKSPENVICIISPGLPKIGTNCITGVWDKDESCFNPIPGKEIVSVKTNNSSKLSTGMNAMYVMPNNAMFSIYFKSTDPNESWVQYYRVDHGEVFEIPLAEYIGKYL